MTTWTHDDLDTSGMESKGMIMESKGMTMESKGMSTRAGMSNIECPNIESPDIESPNIESPDYPAAIIFPRKCIRHGRSAGVQVQT